MTTTHSVEPLRRPLRVWPGVVTAIAVVALRFGLPLVWSDGAAIGILAGVAANWLERGREGLEDSLSGFALCGAILLVCFVLFQIGGGDSRYLGVFVRLNPLYE